MDAKAGSGKTSTLVMLANAISTNKSSVFLAFNKSIAEELSKRLPSHVPAKTFHSFTFRPTQEYVSAKARRRIFKAEPKKLDILWDNLFQRAHMEARSATIRLVGLMRAHAYLPNVDDDSLYTLLSHFNIECESEEYTDRDIIGFARQLLSASNDAPMFDFDDMLYFPVVFNLRLPTFDYVMVDESQDTNPVQRLILKKIVRPNGGRLIAVGDPQQAIYGFRGASHDSMERIAQDFDATVLPLSISYRCPASVIRAAQKYVPNIEARPNAPEGTILAPDKWSLASFVASDLVMCRNTAPLVQLAYKCIAARKPVKIMGRDIGAGLISLIKKLAGRTNDLHVLAERMDAYREKEVSAALAKHQDGKAQSIADKCDSILALIDTLTPEDADDGVQALVRIINGMFSDNGPNITTLCTVHRAKGLEAERAFILDAELMPSKMARQPWQQIQERNLIYVAITRSLDTLVYIDSKSIVD